ncbi:hypothetical protein [Prauserella muralis]|uniref:Uncharacterized protein n=1 Tax=Prauserella muralis TaxID=588067 RepID=A0A2V4B1G7_9PSEU|nr:hypothetical protein [Prauserella muralis]PXY27877.1 hypothetical protein BAY60_16065 [Prauserella muralis]
MTTPWERYKAVLTRLLDEHPEAALGFDDPRVDEGREPPFSLSLAAWAVDLAEEVHARFGAEVDVGVGAMPCPAREMRFDVTPYLDPPAPVAATAELGFALDGPLSLRSGHTVHHGLRVTNRTGAELTVFTNGQVTGAVIDAPTDRVVGGSVELQTQPLVTFPTPAGATRVVPLLVGTASFDPVLGYAVPPGEWALRTTVDLGNDRHVRTPLLPFTVVA